METKAMLFSLIKEEIFGSNENAEIPSAHWEKVYALACLHDLGHIPASALERKGVAEQDELSQRMFKTQMTALYRYELNCHELKAICRVLTEEQIPHMLLKGSVIRDLYPKPYLRTSCDIDLLVKEEDLAKSAAALEAKLGYTASKEPAYHDLSLYSPSGVHLELHFNLLEHSMPMDSVLSRVWEFSLLREGYTYVQEAAFLLFHTVAHMAYHFSHGGCGIKPFMDLKLLHDKADYDK
ncbi:MAG: nucleotidyltransferase family protein, partial [Clostridia bacterium]|nr:nucleotidyltransferase family protein [Clostridia bacterium]